MRSGEVQVVGRPHLVLTDPGDPDGVLTGGPVQVSDDLLGLEKTVVSIGPISGIGDTNVCDLGEPLVDLGARLLGELRTTSR